MKYKFATTLVLGALVTACGGSSSSSEGGLGSIDNEAQQELASKEQALKEAREALEKEREQWEKEFKKAQAELEKNREQAMADLQKELEDLRAQAEREAESEALNNRIAELEGVLEGIEEEHQAKIDQLLAELEAKNEELERLLAELEKKKEDIPLVMAAGLYKGKDSALRDSQFILLPNGKFLNVYTKPNQFGFEDEELRLSGVMFGDESKGVITKDESLRDEDGNKIAAFSFINNYAVDYRSMQSCLNDNFDICVPSDESNNLVVPTKIDATYKTKDNLSGDMFDGAITHTFNYEFSGMAEINLDAIRGSYIESFASNDPDLSDFSHAMTVASKGTFTINSDFGCHITGKIIAEESKSGVFEVKAKVTDFADSDANNPYDCTEHYVGADITGAGYLSGSGIQLYLFGDEPTSSLDNLNPYEKVIFFKDFHFKRDN